MDSPPPKQMIGGRNSLSIPMHSFLSYPFLFKMWNEKLSLCSNCNIKVIPKLKISCYIPFLFTWLGLGTQTCYGALGNPQVETE